ncbi:alpha/beta hydrolase [Nocardia sp. 2]|uniref:Alpha/beta hydrolase n=1 Tax=Nocardia acididurans TaxID=2802282 RepID=A0ABS1MIE4_9NOCA|nr:alpha/beta hydrolase [Nocardia acididurans]
MEAVRFAHAAAAAAGLRLIAVDRPGMGVSEMTPCRQVVDWMGTVEAVADQMGLDEFAVLGASGGGPYALAAAYRMPDRVSQVVLVSAFAPVVDGDKPVPGKGKRAGGLMILRKLPFLARPAAARMAQVVRTPQGLAALIKQMSPADQARIARDDQLLANIGDNIRVCFEAGSRGVAADLQRVLVRPWGFELYEVSTPTVSWHGDSDANVPAGDARRLAAALPNAELEIVEGVGHLLFVDHAAAVLASLRGSRQDQSRNSGGVLRD